MSVIAFFIGIEQHLDSGICISGSPATPTTFKTSICSSN